MKVPGESADHRRTRLAAEIARQRIDLVVAYRNLGKPLSYTENAMRGFGFLRDNSWIFSAVPATLSIGSALFSLIGWGTRKPSALTRSERQRLAELERERLPKGFAGKLMKWGGHGFKIFKLYRRVRRLLP
jgi:hypothetical protein